MLEVKFDRSETLIEAYLEIIKNAKNAVFLFLPDMQIRPTCWKQAEKGQKMLEGVGRVLLILVL